ncbi:MAG: response regulator [Myxococcota bacterium]
MDKDTLKARLLATFLGELQEQVRALEANAMALEKYPEEARPEILKALFRVAHSLKGAARSAGVPLIEAACHRLEETLGRARDGLFPVGPDLVPELLATVDALSDAGRRMRAGEELRGGPLAMILTRMEDAGHLAAPPPSSSPAPARVAPVQQEGEGVVRLAAVKLDALVSRSGELLVARRRAERWVSAVAGLRETLSQCLGEWQRVEKPLRRFVSPNHGETRHARPERLRPFTRRTTVAVGRTRDGLRKLERDLDRLAHGLASDHRVLEQAASLLEDEVRRVRMLPFGEACEGLERAVRDLAKAAGKEIDLVVEGADVELDRAILAGLRDPLLHLVRNAVDHGIETPAERIARGKPAHGCIRVAAVLKGTGVQVVVDDDGRGIDVDAIREQARKRNLPVPDDDRDVVRLIFLAGFSTSRLITELSGRGIGLDVVGHQIQALHGGVDLSFQPGRGTRFLLTLPLTLTTLRVLLVQCAGRTFALPSAQVRRIVRAGLGDLGSVEGREVLLTGAAPIPIASLGETLGLGSNARLGAGGRVPLVVVAEGKHEVALAVDDLLAEQDVVVKNLGRRLRRVRHFSGATVLPTGQLSLIIAAAELVQTALQRAPARSIGLKPDERPAAKLRLLVVDDSVTTRSLEKSILEAAGYEVLTAADGAEAWRLLQERGADLVVADVEMPHMDGFALTEAIRSSKRFRKLPVILVTALETERGKARGLEVGADAYLLKSTFDQKQLIEVITSLL